MCYSPVLADGTTWSNSSRKRSGTARIKPMSRLKRLVLLLKTRQLGLVLKVLRQKVYSGSDFFCLRRDLTEAFEAPTAKISLTPLAIHNDEPHNLLSPTP